MQREFNKRTVQKNSRHIHAASSSPTLLFPYFPITICEFERNHSRQKRNFHSSFCFIGGKQKFPRGETKVSSAGNKSFPSGKLKLHQWKTKSPSAANKSSISSKQKLYQHQTKALSAPNKGSISSKQKLHQ